MAETKTTFDDADAYERFMGRWSRAVGEKFLAWIGAPKNASWLDVGCGTGAFTELILKTCAPAKVVGIDPAPAQIEAAKKQVTAPQASFQPGTAVYLPFKIGEFDVVVSALVIHFVPDRPKSFREMLRVAKPGGLIAGYTWERSGTDVIGAPYGPMARGITQIGAEPILSAAIPEAMPEILRAALEAAGYKDIDVTVIEASAGYPSFDDYWTSQTPAFAPIGKAVAALSESDRKKLQDLLRKTLPAAADGSIRYSARATSFKARKPD
jgi:ubiquinone/menaquinone biosynthesis C-methylase UbiE